MQLGRDLQKCLTSEDEQRLIRKAQKLMSPQRIDILICPCSSGGFFVSTIPPAQDGRGCLSIPLLSS